MYPFFYPYSAPYGYNYYYYYYYYPRMDGISEEYEEDDYRGAGQESSIQCPLHIPVQAGVNMPVVCPYWNMYNMEEDD